MLVEEGFEIIDSMEIFNQLLLEWESNPQFLTSQLYLDFLKYDIKPTSEDFQKWKDNLLEQKLEKIYTVEDLENTLNEMEDINELASKLENFSSIILKNKPNKKNLVENLTLDVKDLKLPIIPWYYKYYTPPIKLLSQIVEFIQSVADFSVSFIYQII